MKITNRANLPEALVRAVENDPYSKGDCDFSVTELLSPPRANSLKHAYHDLIEEDAEDRLWSLYGQIAHLILERANVNAIAEKRYFGKIGDATVSAQVDTLELVDGVLSDWKFTTSWKFKANTPPPPEWIAQLNMQLELLRVNGIDAKKLQIVGLLRDFSKLEALRSADYPQTSVKIMPLPIWPREQTREYMRERIALHRQARLVLPECTPEERWAKPDTFAVMKWGRKSAVRLYTDSESAADHAGGDEKLYIKLRRGVNTRCEQYCSVSKFCSQYHALKPKQEIKE